MNRLYGIWCAMKRRCYNPNAYAFERYGGRGLVVCDRWRESFAAFVEDMGPRPDGYELDRIDNDGNYEPGNCRWVSPRDQVRNRSVTLKVKIGSFEYPLATWCELSGVPYGRAIQRLRAGWEPHHLVLLPPRQKQLINGRKPADLARELSVDVATIYRRSRLGTI